MIIFFGPPGAGKSVQGQILAARHGWRWLSAGQLLRDSRDISLIEDMRAGKLADTEKVNKIVGDAIQRAKDIDRIILDGFPRQPSQAEWLIDSQAKHERSIAQVILINVDRDDLLDRLRLRGRLDDMPEVINDRLETYAEETGKVLDIFAAYNIHISVVDGSGTVGEVHDRIEDELKKTGVVV